MSEAVLTCVVISDTHTYHDDIKELPSGDVLIHCGDFTKKGKTAELVAFREWFGAQPHRYKLV